MLSRCTPLHFHFFRHHRFSSPLPLPPTHPIHCYTSSSLATHTHPPTPSFFYLCFCIKNMVFAPFSPSPFFLCECVCAFIHTHTPIHHSLPRFLLCVHYLPLLPPPPMLLDLFSSFFLYHFSAWLFICFAKATFFTFFSLSIFSIDFFHSNHILFCVHKLSDDNIIKLIICTSCFANLHFLYTGVQ